MSPINKSLRRVGIVGLSTLVAASMMTLSAATTYAAAGDYAAASTPLVTAPQTAALAGNLSLEFANSWTTGASQTFTVGSNNCLTVAGIAAAVEFSAPPTATVSDPGAANVGGTMPTPTAVLGSSSAACVTAGITDRITYTQAGASTGVVTDTYLLTLTNVKYNVGATTPAGNVSVATAGSFKTSGSVVNAVVAGTTFTNTAKVLAVPAATASLGTQTLVENTPGAFFGPGLSTTPVVLTLSSSVFTAGITPTITLPAGYTHSTVVTTAIGTYAFTVTSPATPVAATMTISGLTITAGAAKDVTLTVSGGVVNPAAVTVVRIVDYTARTGGTDRYATAVALLNSLPADTDVVLSSGANFPDALSANYLAGRLGTGTLLTTPTTLPSVVRAALISRHIATVYITGLTGAVSQTVENQIEAMHVDNVPANAFITVVRLGGADRYATNKVINEHNFLASGTVLLATGANFADALSVGPIANHKLFPLILTRGVTLGSIENAQLSDFHPTTVLIAGGTGVVSQAIQDSLTSLGYTVVRLAGLDRTLTAAAVATYATTSLAFNTTTAYITNGANFADALAAGPVAGQANHVIMPSLSPTLLGAGIPLYFGTKTVGMASPANIGILHALGLTGAVSNEVMSAAAMAIG